MTNLLRIGAQKRPYLCTGTSKCNRGTKQMLIKNLLLYVKQSHAFNLTDKNDRFCLFHISLN